MNAGHMTKYESALQEIRVLAMDLPGGIDYDAERDDPSPADMTAHIGGLIWQAASEALDGPLAPGGVIEDADENPVV